MTRRIISWGLALLAMLGLTIVLLAIPGSAVAETANPDVDVGCAVFCGESPPALAADHPQRCNSQLSFRFAAAAEPMSTSIRPVADQLRSYRAMRVHDMVILTADKLVMNPERPGRFDARLENVRLLT